MSRSQRSRIIALRCALWSAENLAKTCRALASLKVEHSQSFTATERLSISTDHTKDQRLPALDSLNAVRLLPNSTTADCNRGFSLQSLHRFAPARSAGSLLGVAVANYLKTTTLRQPEQTQSVTSSTAGCPAHPKACRQAQTTSFGGARQLSTERQQPPEDHQQEESLSTGKSAGPVKDSGWLEDWLPPSWLPYAYTMRLDKPIGTWLLAWPCFWSIAMASPSGELPDLGMLALFGSGALLLRGAGCTVNDLWDRDLDARVERTRTRPLASGAISPFQGLCLLAGQLSLGLGILLQLNMASIVLGASSLGLVFTYPLMKRITFWPQAYLGLTFNWGALLGYTAIQGACNWPTVLPLYAGGVCWTLVYDTIYAHQDRLDDTKAGVKSTALLFADKTRPWLSGFAAAATGLWVTSGYMAGAGAPFYVGVGAAGAHMLWQIWRVDLDSGADCMAKFVSNRWLGGLVFSGIVVDKLL